MKSQIAKADRQDRRVAQAHRRPSRDKDLDAEQSGFAPGLVATCKEPNPGPLPTMVCTSKCTFGELCGSAPGARLAKP